MKYRLFHDSRIGGRRSNEDRLDFRASEAALLMVLADGVGGCRHGARAAETAVRALTNFFARRARPRLADPQAFLADALADAHLAVLALTASHLPNERPCTTCVACVIQDDSICWAHAGDSRLYLLRGGALLARSRDHSRARQLLDAGAIKADALRTHPGRHVLTSCLGGRPNPRFEFSARLPLQRHDVVLLCSDGVWGPLENDAPIAQLSRRDPVHAAAQWLDHVESVAGPERDNLSLLLLEWQGDDGAPPSHLSPESRHAT